MTIKVTYNVTDVYMSQSVSPVYINISYSDGGASGGGVWGTITGTLSNQTDLQTALDLKVPYSGATGDVSLGEYGINVGNVIYDTTPTGIPTEQGATYWDADAETVALIMNGTIQKIGEDTFYHVRNTTGSTIAKGTAVRFSGTTGNSGRLLIAPMLADGTYPSQYYMGITSEELVNNADGKVYHFGKMRNINTSAFADGDVLYVSPSVAGALTATAPVAPNNIIVSAAVVHAANNGTLMIRTTLGSNINADEGVLLTTPTANQGLFYDSGLWVNKSITTALGYTPVPTTRNITINGVTYDLSADRTWTVAAGISGSGASGQVTYWTGASAVSGSSVLTHDAALRTLKITGATGNYILDLTNTANSTAFRFEENAVLGAGVQYIGSTFSVANRRQYLELIGTNGIAFRSTGAELARFNGSNLLLNGTTDSGQRLQVYGDTLLRGSGATNATTALTVQNSSSQNILRVLNNGELRVGNGQFLYVFPYSTVYDTLDINGSNFSIYPTQGSISLGGGSQTTTSGNANNVITKGRFFPLSGTATFADIRCEPLINQTGGANGVTRGLYVNPTLTAAADFRAIETTAGNVLFGSNFFWNNTNARLGIGIATPAVSLDVRTSAVGELAYFANTAANSGLIIGTQTNVGYISSISSLSALGFGINGATSGIRIFTNSNVAINSAADLGVRFGVIGDTLLRGSGATSATTALTVQNSSSTNLFTVRNDGVVNLGTTLPTTVATQNIFGTSTFVGVSIKNNSTASGSTQACIVLESSTSSIASLFKTGSNYTTYKIITANDLGFYNSSAGDISILNDFATGRIKFAAGGSSTAHVTIKTGGQVRFHPLASAPSGAEAGDVYYNSTDNKHYGYNGTTWNAFY